MKYIIIVISGVIAVIFIDYALVGYVSWIRS